MISNSTRFATESASKAAVLSSRTKPPIILVDPENIPDGLKSFDRWMGWSWVWDPGTKKWTKPPIDATTGRSGSSTDPAKWCSFEQALAGQENGIVDGIGFALGAGDCDLHFSGIDLDDCRDRDSGELNEFAQEIIATMDTYCEVSPSGTGIKLLLLGKLSKGRKTKNKAGTIEIYTGGRYFTATGQHIEGTPQRAEHRQDQLKSVWQKYIGSEQPDKKEPGNTASDAHADCMLAMLTTTKNMADNADGSKRLFTVACRAVEHDLSDDEALATIRSYEAERPFPKAWSDDEILQRIQDAEQVEVRGSAIVIRNFTEIEGEQQTKKIIVPKPMTEIIGEINQHRSNWPRRIDNVLFIDDEHGLSWFDRHKAPGLFGWLRRHHPVSWKAGSSLVTQAELFAEVERTAHRYEAIECFPHEPPIDRIYYRGTVPPLGDGSRLRWLLDRFRPETTIDRDLIQAAFMTAIWGGPAGCRPCFVITSDAGRGVGKSTVAQLVGQLLGGFIDVSAGEDIASLKTRMLTPAARTQRIALIDNIKTMRLSWAELEAMITATTISGRQLYIGEGQRPNLLTWFLTLNGVSLATDMAQRSVIIKIVKGENEGTWLEETRAYIEQHRDEIIGDLIAALRGESFPLAAFSRWATWEEHVLSRLPEPGEAQRLILERQGEANCELDEAEIIEGHFVEQLVMLGYCPQTVQVRIPVAIVARWFCEATNERGKTAAIGKRLGQMWREGQLKSLSPDTSRHYGRCFVWTGLAADVLNEPIRNDLLSRVDKYNQERGDSWDVWDG